MSTRASDQTVFEQLREAALALQAEVQPAAAVVQLEDLLEELAQQPSSAEGQALEALLRSRLAESLRLAGQLQEAFEQALSADSLARQADDGEARARALLAMGHIFFQVGHLDEARRRLEQVQALQEAPPSLRAHARMNVAALLRAEGRLAESAVAFDDILPLRSVLEPDLRCSLLINAASCFHQVDRLQDARDALDEARAELPVERRPDLSAWTDAIGAWVASRARAEQPAVELAQAALAPRRPGAGLAVRSSAARALADVASWSPRLALRESALAALQDVLGQAEEAHALAETRDLRLDLAALREAQGDLAQAVVHLREARRLEADLRRHGDRLHLEQEALRAELVRMQVEAESLRRHQERLASANRALVAAETARTRLLATLAHDLRSPLTSVLALVDLVDPEDPDSVRSGLDTLARTVDRMVALLDGALNPPNRIDQPHSDLAEQARRSADSFEALASRKGQRIQVEALCASPVAGDPVALGRLIDNLVSNALKYGPEQGVVQIAVTCSRGRAQLEVMDQGPGFPGVDPAEGLLYGHQLSSRATGGEDGWGLGLHTVYQLLAELGGILALGNRPEGGAVVRVTLPMA